jgi:hypothetical protein
MDTSPRIPFLIPGGRRRKRQRNLAVDSTVKGI